MTEKMFRNLYYLFLLMTGESFNGYGELPLIHWIPLALSAWLLPPIHHFEINGGSPCEMVGIIVTNLCARITGLQ